jgi:Zinc finger, C2H2 type
MYCCDEMECDERFDNFSALVVHRQTHLAEVDKSSEAERYICFHCGKTYAQKFNLYTHIKENHRSDRSELIHLEPLFGTR